MLLNISEICRKEGKRRPKRLLPQQNMAMIFFRDRLGLKITEQEGLQHEKNEWRKRDVGQACRLCFLMEWLEIRGYIADTRMFSGKYIEVGEPVSCRWEESERFFNDRENECISGRREGILRYE